MHLSTTHTSWSFFFLLIVLREITKDIYIIASTTLQNKILNVWRDRTSPSFSGEGEDAGGGLPGEEGELQVEEQLLLGGGGGHGFQMPRVEMTR